MTTRKEPRACVGSTRALTQPHVPPHSCFSPCPLATWSHMHVPQPYPGAECMPQQARRLLARLSPPCIAHVAQLIKHHYCMFNLPAALARYPFITLARPRLPMRHHTLQPS